MLPPSIFNDVLGPVMRGPSSSHSAASVRIGRLTRDLAGSDFHHVLIEFDPQGSLATTHQSQGSDMGLFGGLLGWEADDPRLPDGHQELQRQNISVEIQVRDIQARHPNTYQLTITSQDHQHQLIADSLGGGMILVHQVDGQPVQWYGDQHVTLIAPLTIQQQESLRQAMPDLVQLDTGERWTVIAGPRFVPDDWIQQQSITQVRRLHPVLPVPTPSNLSLPFCSTAEMVAMKDPTSVPLSWYALEYETARSGWNRTQVLQQMDRILSIMRGSLDAGLAGTESSDRILGVQSQGYRQAMAAGQLLGDGLLNQAVLYVTALMEAKSGMEVIVAAPTAGSCGTFPGTCLAAIDHRQQEVEKVLPAMLGGGLIGVLVATRSSFAAEVGGCQAETGAGSAMAAATLVEMMGGNAAQSLSAASLALQNVLGLVCDPVANRVEAPCLGRNVSGAANAIVSANMALAGFDALIPFDEVLDAHREISHAMPRQLRCTALGGLSTTPTSKAIELRLAGGCQSGGCQGGGC